MKILTIISLMILLVNSSGCMSVNSITSYRYDEIDGEYKKVPVCKDIQKGFGFKGAQFVVKAPERTVTFEQKDVFDNVQDIIKETAKAVPTVVNAGTKV